MKNFYLIQRNAFVISFLFVCMANGFALNYTITFTGSTTPDSTIVQNITKGTSITIPAGQALYLTDTFTNNNDLPDTSKDISLYPNPVSEVSTLIFNAPVEGNVSINIVDVSGRSIFTTNQSTNAGLNSFKLKLPQGIFFIDIVGDGFSYTEKAICNSNNLSKPSVSNIAKSQQRAKKSAGIAMIFNDGDVLIYNSISGKNTAIMTDSPTGSKTVNFIYIECKDADNNYYGTTKIGDLYWMASNLKTTKYRNGEAIPNVSDANDWKYLYSPGWCNYDNNVDNGHIYGKIYNYYTVADSRNIAPPGWHVATKEEWAALVNHVSTHWSFIVSETKALASREGWGVSTQENTPGYQPWLNNFSGFNALAGGNRGGFYNGTFFNMGGTAFWWTATDYINIMDAYFIYFSFDVKYTIIDYNRKQYGCYVRCVKDY